MIPAFNYTCALHDYHSPVTVSVGELYANDLINWGPETEAAPSLDWSEYSYTPEQFARVCDMFVQRFWFRELDCVTLKPWCIMVVELFREGMQKYAPLYKAMEDAPNPLQDFDNYVKERNVFSDFPATQIAPKNQDYASNATDRERENIQIGDLTDKVSKYIERYKSVDVMLLDDMAPLIFSNIYTLNISGY